MIGKLTGRIDVIGNHYVLIDVNGVGYIVSASGRTLSHVGSKGDIISLWIETHVREDNISLYGFCDVTEQQWFKLLITVQGVGAKAALSILSVASPDELSLAIAAQDKAVFTRAEGVGPKLATRLVTELKDKAGQIDLSSMVANEGSTSISLSPVKIEMGEKTLISEALSALVNLGYGRSEALIALNTAWRELGEEIDLSSLIKRGLKELAA